MKKIVFFTDGFPYDPGETSFIYNELCELAKHFEITIISYTRAQFADSESCVKLPENVSSKKYVINPIGRKDIIIQLPSIVASKAYKNECAFIKGESDYRLMKKEVLVYMARTFLLKKWIEKNIDIDSTDIFYTYWNTYATLAIAMLKEYRPSIRLVTRMHGYDLYDERTRYGRQYFKSYIDGKVNKICFIAEHGMEFYKSRYGSVNDNRYVISRIGVQAAGNIPIKSNDEMAKKRYTIASCSSVIPLKRVELIVNALEQIDEINVKWIHIGSGSEFDTISKLCRERLVGKENIEYELKGYMDNSSVREFYDREYIDFFITTSSTEGSPVSIQEALAYGMVIIGTNVGEVPKLVEGNGILLDTNPKPEEISNSIMDLCKREDYELISLRKKAFEKWQMNYDATKNAKQFISLLESL